VVSEWLLETATSIVESKCEARGGSVASGFIAAPTDEDHERGGESG
jgi:hypothetical protein